MSASATQFFPSDEPTPAQSLLGKNMGHFFVQAIYKPEAMVALARTPQNRIEVVKTVIEKLGGKYVAGGLVFGESESELLIICELPDNVAAAAFALAVNVGGMVKSMKTTPMITGDEGMDAMARAARAGYRPPGI